LSGEKDYVSTIFPFLFLYIVLL